MGSQAPLGTKPLWNTEGVGLPGYVREIARSLMENGKSKSQAIQLAIGIVRRWARGGGNVTEKTRAKAAKAVAEFEAARAKARATPNKTAHGLAADALALATVELDNSGSGPTATQLDTASRRAHARRGIARPDGSYPIRNATDLANAIAAYGRSKPADRAKVRAHIVKRAKTLGLEAKLPDAWRQVAASHGPFDALALASRDGGPQRYRHGWIPINGAGDKPRKAEGASAAKRPKLDAAQVQDVRDRLAVLEQHAPEIARRQRTLLNGLHADGKLTSDRLRIAKGGIDRLIANHWPRTPSSDPDLVAFSHEPAEALALATKTYSDPKSGTTTVSKADADDPRVKAMAAKLMAKGYGNLERCTKVAVAVIRRGKGAKGGNTAKVAASHSLALGNGPSCQCGGPHDLVFYANRSTPQVVDAGKPAEPKKGYGKVTRRRRANASEEKQIKSGQWIRVDQSGNKPSDDSYKTTKYRPSLVKAAQEATMPARAALPIEQVAARLALAGRHGGPQRFRHGWIPITAEDEKKLPSGFHGKVSDADTARLKAADATLHEKNGDKLSPGHKVIKNELARRERQSARPGAPDAAEAAIRRRGGSHTKTPFEAIAESDPQGRQFHLKRMSAADLEKADRAAKQPGADNGGLVRTLVAKERKRRGVKTSHAKEQDTTVTNFDIDAARLALSNLQSQLDELALAMPPQLAKAQKVGKTGAKKTPKSSSTSGSTAVNPDAAKSDVQIPAGQGDAFKKLVAQIMKRPGMDQEKAEKVAAALLRNRKPAKTNA